MSADRRLTPARPDLAAAHLRGTVEATAFAEPRPHRVTKPAAYLHPRPDPKTAPDTELLHGEPFDVYEARGGWAWGQSGLDGYVGYLRLDALAAGGAAPTHAVKTLWAQTYRAPELKSPPTGALPFGARVCAAGDHQGYVETGSQTWIAAAQLRALDAPADDWVATAEMFLGVPYVWGGRSSTGLDCSALVQLALQAAGRECPRDSDMQEAILGRTLDPGTEPARGDLVFWKGHVGIMRDARTLLHANAHHMAVAAEPLAAAIARIAAAGGGEVTRRTRLDGGTPNT